MLPFKIFFFLKTAGKNVFWNGVKHLCKNLVQMDFKKKNPHHNQGAYYLQNLLVCPHICA